MSTLPTLSGAGFTNDGRVKLYKLFAYFIASDYSQTVLYYGNVSSLKYLLMKYGDDFTTLKSEINSTLMSMYRRYFPTVEVNTDVVEENGPDGTVYNKLTIEITCIDKDNKEYSLTQDIRYANDIIQELDNILTRLNQV